MSAKDLYAYGTSVLISPKPAPPIAADRTAPVLVEPKRRVLKSELPGISDDAWTEYVLAMKTASPSSVSASNALGMFEMKIRRLADLGYIQNLACLRSPVGRMVWTGDFVAPLSRDKFLKDRGLQYKIFCDSTKDYLRKLESGEIAQPEDEDNALSVSGMLAILHRCGPRGLERWREQLRFPETVDLCERANGAF